VSDAARVAISFGVAASFSFTERTAAASLSLGNPPPMRRSNSARRGPGAGLGPSFPGLGGGLPPQAALRPLSPPPARIGDGAFRPTELLARAADFIGAERRAVGLLRACLIRRAEADDGAAGDQRGPVAALRLLERLGDRLGIVPVDARRRPARGLEALDLID